MVVAPLVNRSRLVLGACVLALLVSACTGDADAPRGKPSPEPTRGEARSLVSTAQDLLPGLPTAPMARSNLPSHIEVPERRPPSLLSATPARAKLGMVRLDDDFSAEGFVDHDVYFLGVDDQWRVLNLADLGLPANDWTGPDGSGMGQLSPTGSHWVFETNRHIVVLDLLTRRLKFLSLPGHRQPVGARWTVRNTLLVGFTTDAADLTTTSYEVDAKTGRSSLIKAPHWRVTVLAEGSRAVGGLRKNQPYVDYLTATNKPIRTLKYGFPSDQVLGMQVRRDVAVFLDSLAKPDQPDHGSTLVVVDTELRHKATLPWPKRSNGDSTIGWVSDDTYLLTYGKTMAVWCPDESKISRMSTVPRDLDISLAMDVIEASCA